MAVTKLGPSGVPAPTVPVVVPRLCTGQIVLTNATDLDGLGGWSPDAGPPTTLFDDIEADDSSHAYFIADPGDSHILRVTFSAIGYLPEFFVLSLKHYLQSNPASFTYVRVQDGAGVTLFELSPNTPIPDPIATETFPLHRVWHGAVNNSTDWALEITYTCDPGATTVAWLEYVTADYDIDCTSPSGGNAQFFLQLCGIF